MNEVFKSFFSCLDTCFGVKIFKNLLSQATFHNILSDGLNFLNGVIFSSWH